jgi:hypothetical protein
MRGAPARARGAARGRAAGAGACGRGPAAARPRNAIDARGMSRRAAVRGAPGRGRGRGCRRLGWELGRETGRWVRKRTEIALPTAPKRPRAAQGAGQPPASGRKPAIAFQGADPRAPRAHRPASTTRPPSSTRRRRPCNARTRADLHRTVRGRARRTPHLPAPPAARPPRCRCSRSSRCAGAAGLGGGSARGGAAWAGRRRPHGARRANCTTAHAVGQWGRPPLRALPCLPARPPARPLRAHAALCLIPPPKSPPVRALPALSA